MLVQLLYFPNCPNVDAARTRLALALSDVTDPALRSRGLPGAAIRA
jgi:hypothetical protein